MPSRSEGWGGLFKDEAHRLIRSASRASIRWLRDFEQTTPALRACPSLLRRGIIPIASRNVTVLRKPVLISTALDLNYHFWLFF